ncbi:MAG TPA: MotA/TolQ/ExbB proton channel family protein [Bacteroidia bacterium]|nr:MotA/TolQ/ExbB proton channel family protein [Bacteroidia bacterium]
MLNHILLQIQATADSVANAVNNAPPPSDKPGVAEVAITPMELVMKGGWIMIPLIILLLLAVYFAIERMIVISKAGKLDRHFMHNIKDYLLSGKIDSARELCRATNTPVSRTIEKGISRLGKPTREIIEAMESQGRLEISRVEKNMHILSMTARIAPMLGFIGTIAGVVTIFYHISLSGDISIKSISGGLYQKMVSSGAGLVIGVIAFIFYHFLNTAVDGIAKKIERTSLEFLDVINEPSK